MKILTKGFRTTKIYAKDSKNYITMPQNFICNINYLFFPNQERNLRIFWFKYKKITFY